MTLLKRVLTTIVEPKHLQLSYRLHKLVDSCESLCDLGGGSGAAWGDQIPKNVKTRVVVDQYQAGLDIGVGSGVYTRAIKQDVLTFLRAQGADSFDVVLATSVIEHLPTEAGAEMATEMKRVAKHIAIIYTPNGFVIQPPDVDNPFKEHLSGWDSHTLEALGYEFAGGFSGLKFLRTTHGSIRFKSPKIGTLLILLSTFLTKQSKRFAFEILCVAKKNRR